jgi:hypothetical protein
MAVKRVVLALILFFLLIISVQAAYAGIKVENGECPVYISHHQMGNQIVKDRNGSLSILGAITGFASPKFPVDVSFRTLTTFLAVRRYQTEYASMVLTDSSGRNKLVSCDFKMIFEQEGAPYVQIADWKVRFPAEGFYAFNIFVDGTLVGYYPFYISHK